MKFLKFGRKKTRTVLKAAGESARVTRDAGDATITHGADGKTHISIDKIAAVGIYHLAEVADYRIVRAVGMESHSVTLKNGTVVSFAYNDRGQLVEFSADGPIAFELDENNAVQLSLPPSTGGGK
jgi:hypothetical protein